MLVPPVRIKKEKKLFMRAEDSMMHTILHFSGVDGLFPKI